MPSSTTPQPPTSSGADLNEVSTRLFIEDGPRRKPKRVKDELQVLIKRLRRKNMTVSVLRESFLSLTHLIQFIRQGPRSG